MRKISIVLILLVALIFPNFTIAMAENPFYDRYDKVEEVYLCGFPIGITIDGDGVEIIGLNEYITAQGVSSPAREVGLMIGDRILEMDNVKITNVSTLTNVCKASKGNQVTIKYKRQNEICHLNIIPTKDLLSDEYKIGICVKDTASGIGTMTYIKKNSQFGCLGHPIVNPQTKEIEKITSNGYIYNCTIDSVVKGEKGSAGELRGTFDINKPIGSIYINNRYGVYGNMSQLSSMSTKLYPVAKNNEIVPGKAKILSTISGDEPQEYDIEIVRVFAQTSISDKGLVIRVTDERLLSTTGGIVQGMSGSPIVQNGKFVGAVTHVFVNDPTKGYGILAQWMLKN